MPLGFWTVQHDKVGVPAFVWRAQGAPHEKVSPASRSCHMRRIHLLSLKSSLELITLTESQRDEIEVLREGTLQVEAR